MALQDQFNLTLLWLVQMDFMARSIGLIVMSSTALYWNCLLTVTASLQSYSRISLEKYT